MSEVTELFRRAAVKAALFLHRWRLGGRGRARPRWDSATLAAH